MKLPNPDLAFLDNKKLTSYSLNLEHDEGKHKARVFKSASNMTIDNLEELKNALFQAVKNYDAIPDKTNAYGQKYIINFPLTRKNKTAIVHSSLDS